MERILTQTSEENLDLLDTTFVDLNNENKEFFLNYITIEQDADLTYFQHSQEDIAFYNFSRSHNYTNFKFLKKIWHSAKLRVKYYNSDNLLFKQNNFEFLIFNFKFQILMKKFFFLNRWGRVKFLKFTTIFPKIYFYFYKNMFLINPLFLFKWWKSLDKKLFSLSVLKYLLLPNNLIYYYPAIDEKEFKQYFWNSSKFELKNINKKITITRLFRSIPRVKIWNSILNQIELSNNFMEFNNFTLVVNSNFNLILLSLLKNFKKILNSFKNLNNVNVKFLKEFKIFSKTNVLRSYFLILLEIFSLQITSDFITFILNLIFPNFFLLSYTVAQPYIDILYLASYSNLRKNFYFCVKEWFTKFYIKNNWYRKKKFKFFQGFLKNNYEENYFLKNNFLHISTYTIETYTNSFTTFKNHGYPSKLNLKKKLNFSISFSNLISYFKLTSQRFYFKVNKSFYISSSNLKLLNITLLWNKSKKLFCKNNFSLSLHINYLLFFNKYLHLDVISSFLHANFFFNQSFYNIIIFFKYHYFTFFSKKLKFSLLLTNVEFFFFKKLLVFLPQIKSFLFYLFSLKTYTNCLLLYKPKPWSKFNNLLIKKFWFNHWVFIEELYHLSREFIYNDLERVQEYVRTKQLAELRLIKLTDYLKKMRLLKIDPGNIQYSPDFTQEHEFALTLKWGVELEMLKFTRLIIMRWFFGKIGLAQKNNLVRKKINFLYNLLKPEFTKIPAEQHFISKRATQEILSLKNVYELTRIHLATIVASYKNIHKFKYQQLNNFHYKFNFFDEQSMKTIYRFLFSVFDRYFLIDMYKKYYLKTKIKKKIWLRKMVYKKVFKRFVLSTQFFKILFFKKNVYNFFYFSYFWKIKKKLIKTFRSWYFFNMLHNLLTKHYRSFLLPSTRTLEDYKIFTLELSNLNSNYSNKYLLFTNNSEFEVSNSINILYLKIFSKRYNFCKYFITNNRLLEKNLFFIKIEFKSQRYFSALNSILLNFLSEYIYEKFSNFILSTKSNQQFNTYAESKNKFNNPKLFHNVTTSSFSKTFFYFLNSWSLIFNTNNLKNYCNKIFLNEFKVFLLSDAQLEIFIWKLNEFILLNPVVKPNNINLGLNALSYSNQVYLISIINLLNNIDSNFFFWNLTHSIIYRIINFSVDEVSTSFTQKLHFDRTWLKHFTKQFELLTIEFIRKFIHIFINKKF